MIILTIIFGINFLTVIIYFFGPMNMRVSQKIQLGLSFAIGLALFSCAVTMIVIFIRSGIDFIEKPSIERHWLLSVLFSCGSAIIFLVYLAIIDYAHK